MKKIYVYKLNKDYARKIIIRLRFRFKTKKNIHENFNFAFRTQPNEII